MRLRASFTHAPRLNRTNVELKLRVNYELLEVSARLNRTNVELKPTNTLWIKGNAGVLIEPTWN